MEREAVIKIYRLRRVFFDSGMSVSVVIDGNAIGDLWPRQSISHTVSPGNHWIQVRFMVIRRSYKLELSLKEGEEVTLVTGMSMIGTPFLHEAAARDMAQIVRDTPLPQSPKNLGISGTD